METGWISPREGKKGPVIKSLLAVLSAFSALVAGVNASNAFFSPDVSPSDVVMDVLIGIWLISLFGVIFARWRYDYSPGWTIPFLLLGGVGMFVLAFAGSVGGLHGTAGHEEAEYYTRLLKLVFVTQGVLIFVQIQRDRSSALKHEENGTKREIP